MRNGLIIDAGGNKYWYKDDLLHSENDNPSIDLVNCITFIYRAWHKKGKLHRENLPAIEYKNGTREWYKEGIRHRDGDLPAVEYASGTKWWYKEGNRHREDGKPAIERMDGSKEWYYNGEKLEVNSNEEALRLIKMKAFW